MSTNQLFLVLFLAMASLAGCSKRERQLFHQVDFERGAVLEASPGGTLFETSYGEREYFYDSVKPNVEDLTYATIVTKRAVYCGRLGGVLRVNLVETRERIQKGLYYDLFWGMTRTYFLQGRDPETLSESRLEFDVSKSPLITIDGCALEILNADNNSIRARVVNAPEAFQHNDIVKKLHGVHDAKDRGKLRTSVDHFHARPDSVSP